MPAFHEVQFPPKIAYGATGGPEFSTAITKTQGGFEQRNINWQKPLGSWDISTGIKSKADMDAIKAFFINRFGRAHGFRFKDWLDYQGVGQNLGNGNGTKTQFQLTKTYVNGSFTHVRDIKKPVTGTVKIYLNGVLQASGYTLNTTTGMVTFSSAPSSGVVVSADFEFDVPVRFDIDKIAARIDGPGQYVWDAIPIVELRA